jgi:hypothetical protein
MSKPVMTQIIERARALVADRSTWTAHALGRDARGESCDPLEARAVRWCAYGALIRAGYDITGDKNQAHRLAGLAAARMVAGKIPEAAYMAIYSTNDTGGRALARKALLRMFDRGLVAA